MHIVIYALVEASTHDDALATGKTVFDRLVGAEPHSCAVFDYYVTFEEGRQTLDEIREILDRGEGEVVELPE